MVGGEEGAISPRPTDKDDRSRACDLMLAFIGESIGIAEAQGDEDAVALLAAVRDRVVAMRPATLN